MEHTPISPTSAPLESIERFLPTDMGIVPLSAVARALAGFSRDQLGSAVEVMIALMDIADDDPDAEEDDDSGQSTEDEISYGDAQFGRRGPGCEISDPDSAVDDRECDDIDQDREPEDGF